MHYPNIFLTTLIVTILSFPVLAKGGDLDARIDRLHDVIEDDFRHKKLTRKDRRVLNDEVYNLEELSRIFFRDNHLGKVEYKILKRRIKEIKRHTRKLVKRSSNKHLGSHHTPHISNGKVLPGYGVVPDFYLPNY